MPVLSAPDSLGQVLRPGDRVAAPINREAAREDMIFVGGALLGFDPWKHQTEAQILLYPPGDGGTLRVPAMLCRRLGSSTEFRW